MNGENESCPLLHSYETRSFRNKVKIKWLLIPSENTLVRNILWLFFTIVTLIILYKFLEGSEDIWKTDTCIEDSLTGLTVPERCPLSKTYDDFLSRSETANPPIDCALIAEEARRKFGGCIDLSFLPQTCRRLSETKCDSSYKYRMIDGSCNNKIHPTWGKSDSHFVRMIPPSYADGVSTLRTSTSGDPLPNARYLSRQLYSNRTKPDTDLSVMFLYFGLLIDHDMIQVAFNTVSLSCCDKEYQEDPGKRPKECLQIEIADDDPFYGPKNITCFNLKRSLPVNGECGGRREQMNKMTSYIDGSTIYGSNVEQTNHLRTFIRGQLRTQFIHNTPFMSTSQKDGYKCGTASEPLKCFEAGDSRVNMVTALTAMHALWYREHNRIATKLSSLNPHWSDEILFQEARRIVIGELQNIMYSEFLPLLLGKKAMEAYEIEIDKTKVYKGYNDAIDATAFNVFGAAAFRFGHHLAPDTQLLVGENTSTVYQVALHEMFFNNHIFYHDGFDLLLRGAASQRTHNVESYLTPELQNHLFQPSDFNYGFDLAAIGLQRARDHGLPSYKHWRSACGLSEVKTWDDLYDIMDFQRVHALKRVYQSIEDIDLKPGALAENHVPGSLLGPTNICLIGRQFEKTRKGDRFWFEIQNEIGSFSKSQLHQIYKSSMSRIICENSDSITEMQFHSFKIPSNHYRTTFFSRLILTMVLT